MVWGCFGVVWGVSTDPQKSIERKERFNPIFEPIFVNDNFKLPSRARQMLTHPQKGLVYSPLWGK